MKKAQYLLILLVMSAICSMSIISDGSATTHTPSSATYQLYDNSTTLIPTTSTITNSSSFSYYEVLNSNKSTNQNISSQLVDSTGNYKGMWTFRENASGSYPFRNDSDFQRFYTVDSYLGHTKVAYQPNAGYLTADYIQLNTGQTTTNHYVEGWGLIPTTASENYYIGIQNGGNTATRCGFFFLFGNNIYYIKDETQYSTGVSTSSRISANVWFRWSIVWTWDNYMHIYVNDVEVSTGYNLGVRSLDRIVFYSFNGGGVWYIDSLSSNFTVNSTTSPVHNSYSYTKGDLVNLEQDNMVNSRIDISFLNDFSLASVKNFTVDYMFKCNTTTQINFSIVNYLTGVNQSVYQNVSTTYTQFTYSVELYAQNYFNSSCLNLTFWFNSLNSTAFQFDLLWLNVSVNYYGNFITEIAPSLMISLQYVIQSDSINNISIRVQSLINSIGWVFFYSNITANYSIGNSNGVYHVIIANTTAPQYYSVEIFVNDTRNNWIRVRYDNLRIDPPLLTLEITLDNTTDFEIFYWIGYIVLCFALFGFLVVKRQKDEPILIPFIILLSIPMFTEGYWQLGLMFLAFYIYRCVIQIYQKMSGYSVENS